MKKQSLLYKWILIIWFLVSLTITIPLVFKLIKLFSIQNGQALATKIVILVLLVINALIFCLFWLKSTKDLVFTFFFLFKRKSLLKRYDYIINSELSEEFKNKKVFLLYCTCDDFDKEALKKSMKQNYNNYEVVILDDSKKEEYIKQVDDFSKEYNIRVVRRENRIGFKAGNLNNFLKNNTDYDYFVVLDSDEIIPNNFIIESLKYFQSNPKIGALQAFHLISEGKNFFQQAIGNSSNVSSLSIHVLRNLYGETSLAGHGMMLSKEVYEKTGGFPHLLVEDTSISAEVKKNNYEIVYAPNIVCYEEFPVDYIALKKRQGRWTAGNVQYIKKYAKVNRKINYKWFEKIDLRLNHYSLPIIPIISLIFLINFIILGFLKFNITTNDIAFVIIWCIFLFLPLFISVLEFSKQRRLIWALPTFIGTIITYTSMTVFLVASSLLGLFNKRVKFVVTPKESKKIKFIYIVLHSLIPIIFGVGVAVLTYFAWHTILPTLIISLPCVLTPFLIATSNIRLRTKEKVKNKHKQKQNKIKTI
ncbi:Glycan synthase of Mollicutes GsmA [Mycoplasma feriruminatoris]|uniref:glycosyltransferase n=1 Tax=Mycoplasma feriruminatoris TaxID=1179777 RepID=UPI00241C4BA4|nr:glycosyltransferase family 2 protein [Mycoplasma feriruminatoris]WFQ95697.1 Glycan synthase of Mollicutes GsmA [Mycoplasma feriruminatoris]